MTRLSYCGETVRKQDPDRFLLSMFAPAAIRESLWAIYAFNHEIAKTREVVTETQLGLIRLQWWRDEIGKIYDGGAVSEHMILQPLGVAIAAYKLPRELFDSLIYAREFDLEDRQPATLEGMVKYAEFTAAPLLELSLLCHGKKDSTVNDVAAGYALTGILRATPAYLRQRRCYLPENITPHIDDIYAGNKIEELAGVMRVVAEEAAEILKDTAPQDVQLRLHKKLAQMYLAQIRAADFNIFSPSLKIPPALRELRLWWASF